VLTGKFRFVDAACGALVLEVETTEGLTGHWEMATAEDVRELFGSCVVEKECEWTTQ
jgi:hypothetical protein